MVDLAQDASNSLNDLELSRLHYTYEMVDFRTSREDFRYIFQNKGPRPHRIAPLAWRWREIQANMYVLDAGNANLIYLPSDETRRTIQLYLENLLESGAEQAGLAPTLQMENLRMAIKDALEFESDNEVRRTAHRLALRFHKARPHIDEFRRVSLFLALLRDFYIPFAILPMEIDQGEYVFIRHGVDLYSRPEGQQRTFWPHLQPRLIGSWGRAKQYLLGRFHYDVPLALDAVRTAEARSFHIRINVPEGLRVIPPPQPIPEEVFSEYPLGKFSSYDEQNVYLYFGKEELEGIHERRNAFRSQRIDRVDSFRQALTNFQRRSQFSIVQRFLQKTLTGVKELRRDAGRVRLEIRILLGIAHGIVPLIFLLWVAAIVTLMLGITGNLGLDQFLTLLGLVFAISLSIGIFVTNRHILRGFATVHILLAVLLTTISYGFLALPTG